jgi:hypothetical protein
MLERTDAITNEVLAHCIYLTKRRHITEEFTFHSHCRKNFRSHSFPLSSFKFEHSRVQLVENTLGMANIGSLLGIYRRCLGRSPAYLHILFTDLTDNKSRCLYTQHNAIKHFLTCCIKVHAVAQQSQTSCLFSTVKAITNYVCKRCKFLASESQRRGRGGKALVTCWGK